MGNQRKSAKERLWRFGLALAVGIAAALLSLMRVRRPVNRAHVAEHGQAGQSLDSAASPADPVSRVQISAGLRRLALSTLARAGWILVVAGLGVWARRPSRFSHDIAGVVMARVFGIVRDCGAVPGFLLARGGPFACRGGFVGGRGYFRRVSLYALVDGLPVRVWVGGPRRGCVLCAGV